MIELKFEFHEIKKVSAYGPQQPNKEQGPQGWTSLFIL